MQFNENDEILALAHYLDTVVVMVDGLTKNVAAAMTAHIEPMANLTAQLKRVAGRTSLARQCVNAKNNKALARMLGCVNPARCADHFFLGLDIGPTRTI